MTASGPACAIAAGLLLGGVAVPGHADGQAIFDGPIPESRMLGVTFPGVVDSFAVVAASERDEGEWGVNLQLASPSYGRVRVDLWVYPLPPEQDTIPEPERLAYHTDLSVAAMELYYAQSPTSGELTVQRFDTLQWDADGGGSYEGRSVEASVTVGGEATHTRLLMFRKGGGYLHYRVSHPREMREILRPRIEALVRATLGSVETDPRWGGGAPGAAQSGDGSFAHAVFPQAIESFRITSASLASGGERGATLSYRSTDDLQFGAEIELLPVGEAGDSLSPRQLVDSEFEPALESLQGSIADAPGGASAVMERADTLSIEDPSGGTVPGYEMALRISNPQGAVRAYFALFVRDGWFLRYFVTRGDAAAADLEPQFRRFLAETAGGIGLPASSPSGAGG